MNELSLFSGAGGGLLASKLLGWKTVGYVEYEDYCQRVIRARINDGYLDEAPIFSDIRTFLSEGYAESYKGMVDVVTAGFPCQPFSTAGKRQGEDDERNMWPQTIEVIRAIRPRFAFLENVSGLLGFEYIRRIFGDLAESGFNARWDVLGTSAVGGDCSRKRIWIMACSKEIGWGASHKQLRILQKAIERSSRFASDNGTFYAPDCGRYLRKTKPGLGRVTDKFPNRVDRIEAIGNAQDPRLAATAWRLLNVSA